MCALNANSTYLCDPASVDGEAPELRLPPKVVPPQHRLPVRPMGARHPQVPRSGVCGVPSNCVHRHAGDGVRAGMVRAVEGLGLDGPDEADNDRRHEEGRPHRHPQVSSGVRPAPGKGTGTTIGRDCPIDFFSSSSLEIFASLEIRLLA